MSKVKVQMLKNVSTPKGTYMAGKTYELDEEFAKQICTPIKYAGKSELFVKGIILEAPKEGVKDGVPGDVVIPVKNMSVGELRGLNAKNVVKTPVDQKHEQYLASIGAKPSDDKSKANRQKMENRQRLERASQ